MLCGQLINWSYLLLSRPTLGGVNIVSRLYKYYIARTVLYNAYIYNRSRVQRVMVLYNAAIVRRPAPPVHQNLRPYQRWSGVGGDQAPALLGNLGVRLKFHIIQQIMGASLKTFFMFLRMMMKTFLFLPAYALLMIGFFVYPHHPLFLVLHVQTIILYYTFCLFLSALALAKPSVHKIFCISHFGCYYPRPSLSSPSSCKTIRSRNILYFTFCLFFTLLTRH